MAKRKKLKRRRTKSEIVMIVLGMLIALSMILSLFVGLGQSRSDGNAPLPPDQLYEFEHYGEIQELSATNQGSNLYDYSMQ